MNRYLLLLVVALLVQGCARELVMTLQNTPTQIIGVPFPTSLGNAFNRELRLEPLRDVRAVSPDVIGENREGTPFRPVRTTDSVSSYTTRTLRQAFIEWGGKVSDKADLALTGEVHQFFVTETQVYVADVSITYQLKDPSGRIIWEGNKGGRTKRFGRSLSQENYNEVLSDAMRESFAALFRDESFFLVWSGAATTQIALAGNDGVEPEALRDDLVKLVKAGFDDGLLVKHVKQQKLARQLTADEIIDWKRRGIPVAVIDYTVEKFDKQSFIPRQPER